MSCCIVLVYLGLKIGGLVGDGIAEVDDQIAAGAGDDVLDPEAHCAHDLMAFVVVQVADEILEIGQGGVDQFAGVGLFGCVLHCVCIVL